MVTPALRIAPDLALPIEFATEASAVLARRGRGKTYAASVVAEELARAGQPFVVLDPVGVWWGLRSSASGDRGGLEVTILGGEHGDLPLDPTTGARIATFVVDNPAAYILDLSSFESKGAQDRFVADFADRVYRYKSATERRTPLTLIIDEADQFAPQQPRREERGGYGLRMLGALEAIVRLGRARGLGCVLITQRPAVLNKNVLTQAGALILLGITGPQDRKAVDDWVSGHADAAQRHEVVQSLAGLGVGEAWVWWPTEELLRRVQIRRRRTFDSSSTPKVGEHRESVAFATVDLDALKDAMADAVERAKADDPALLRRRVAELERQLKVVPEPPKPEVIEVPVVSEATLLRLEELLAPVAGLLGDIQEHLRFDVSEMQDGKLLFRRQAVGRAASVETRPTAPAQVSRARDTPTEVEHLGKRERAILSVLAQYPQGRTHRQIAMLTGYSPKASTIAAGLSNLRKYGYVEAGGNPIRATPHGVEAIAGHVEPLPTGDALYHYWLNELGKRERAMLVILVEHYPASLGHAEMARLTGYSPEASTVAAGMSKLRGLELADGWRAHPDFIEAIGWSR